MSSISFREGGENVIVVDYINGSMLGSIYKEADGYYVFHASVKGAWSEYILQAICDKLKDLNAAWDAQVEAFLAANPDGVDDNGSND